MLSCSKLQPLVAKSHAESPEEKSMSSIQNTGCDSNAVQPIVPREFPSRAGSLRLPLVAGARMLRWLGRFGACWWLWTTLCPAAWAGMSQVVIPPGNPSNSSPSIIADSSAYSTTEAIQMADTSTSFYGFRRYPGKAQYGAFRRVRRSPRLRLGGGPLRSPENPGRRDALRGDNG